MSATDGDARLEEVRGRLKSRGFLIADDVTLDGNLACRVAHKSRFEMRKFGHVDTFFVFAEFANLQPRTIQKFSASALKFAKASRAFPLPCGMFEGVICYAIAIVRSLEERTAEFIRRTDPPKHWAAFEMPVAYDWSRGTVCYFEMTPAWGSWYYPGFRKEIEEVFLVGALPVNQT